jgi:hypothetical protein
MQRVITKLDTGFSEWPLVDPAVIGDVSGNGQLNSGDVTLLLRQIGGIPQPEIPAIPANIPPIQFAGADPLVSLPRTLSATIGETIVIPVNLDNAQGLESVQLHLSWDASTLTLVGVHRGSLTGSFQYFVKTSEPGSVTIDTSGLQALSGGSGSLVELEFRVDSGAKPGAQLIDLEWARLNDSHLTLTPVPQAGEDPTDGVVRILSPSPVIPPSTTPVREPPAISSPSGRPAAATYQPDPVIDWGASAGLALRSFAEHENDRSGWVDDFVNQLGNSDKERNPNGRIRIAPLPRIRSDV